MSYLFSRFWCAQSAYVQCNVANDRYSQGRSGSLSWTFTVTDEGFGFTSNGGKPYIVKPESIKRDIIKVMPPSSTTKEFWFRRIDDEV